MVPRIRIVESKRDATRPNVIADRGKGRVIDVDDHRGSRRQSQQGRPPAGGNRVELAVAVELIAEEIVEEYEGWFEPARDLRQRRLIALDDADLGLWTPHETGLPSKRAGDASHEIRARAI